MLHSAEAGARTGVYLASSPDVATVTGTYFLDGKPAKSKPVTYDAAIASRMWSVSEELCGLVGMDPKARLTRTAEVGL